MFKIALCQIKVEDDFEKNIDKAYKKINEASNKGAKIVALGEMFNCPYSGKYFSKYAEEENNSKTLDMLRNVSREKGIYIIGGSIPEKEEGSIYNTSYAINPDGEIIAKHRKIHLFDVDIENGIRFCESDYLTKGENITVFDTEHLRIGICICYDIRFPELIRKMTLMGAKLIFVPAAFNMTTGPAHWNILFRTRALDNQIYIAGISPARDYEGVYTAYGHSLVVNPWGEIIAQADEGETIIYADIDINYIEKIRKELPLLKHRRIEIY
ncbi:Predicted amidohydrolase [Caloramator quimbayensis]|uniref:Predicted amidohydrolase n=1 Tax=Caloramator quimbayensis TaxID=1147123 RepID=A0A1T4X6V3_9CLOT|nr:carbon-nitrogen hydrolase family protein [Caloramator quimbayensis]SKA85363.1 Predicted amidohydrolase [Caloramator quimbayensis]